VVAAYKADPLVHERVTATVARFAAEAGGEVLAVAPRWRLPTLLMWAGADRCVAPAGSAALSAAAPRSVLESQPWPGFAHELFNEPERERVLDRLLDWLNAKLG
jgi:alpha-beta hydrolase superfamily lysophospholipase